ncbi:MAG TPA: CHAT domain-containing tetratricopeptide repeat protein, partial [Blastocatellia bacterium]|nr:CHAT domain-containing tetratricopeptide repeat protein [Blastocatellia bacterium]
AQTTENDIARAIAGAADDVQRKKVLEANAAFISIELLKALVSQGQERFNHGDYPAALSLFRVVLELSQSLNATVGPEAADAWLGMGDAEYFQANYDRANANYEKALEIAQQAGYQHGIALGLKDIGNMRQARGDIDGALDFYARSLGVSEAAGDKEAMARVLANMGLMYSRKRDDVKALDYYQRSLKLNEEIGRKDGIARSLVVIGDVYGWKEDYETALSYDERALKLFQEEGDQEGIMLASLASGTYSSFLGDHTAASRLWGEALRIARQIGEKAHLVSCLKAVAGEESRLGRFRQALTYYKEAVEISRKLGDEAGITDISNDIGGVYSAEGNRAEALRRFLEALKLHSERNDKVGMVNPLREIASVYEADGDYATAEDYAQRCLKIAVEISDPGDEAFSYIQLGEIQEKKGASAPALDYANKALSMFERSKDLEGTTSALLLIGDVYSSHQHNYVRAAEAYSRAVSIGRGSNSLDTVWRALTGAGKAYRMLGQNDKAGKSFTEAIGVIEEMRQGAAGGPRQERRFLTDKIAPYEEMVSLLVHDGQQNQALELAERAKARTLLDVLESGKVDVEKAMTADERGQEQKLKSHLNSVNIQMVSARASKNAGDQLLAGLQKELDKARQDFDVFEDGLYVAHPDLGIRRAAFKPVSAEQFGGLISGSDSALLEYVLQGEETFLFVLTKPDSARATADLKVFRISVDGNELSKMVARFRQLLAARSIGYRELASQLYELLIRPAASDLQGKKNIIIVPDETLWELPFQALQSRKGRFLIEDCAVSNAPSLTALREMSRSRKTGGLPTKTLIAMGNPKIGNEELTSVKEQFRGADLSPLPDAERQVESLARMYGPGNSEVYVGAEATEATFKKEVGKYRIIDLATHAIVNDANPMYSQIVLARGNDDEDGLLEAWEIMNLDLHADLVVLSACDTGLGELRTGEGVIGLSWALFVAGCPTTVVSQWKVESSSTTELVVEFHKRMLGGQSKAEALRGAELSLLKKPKYRNPFYWAPFVIVGESN